jgi:L-arabinose isomerase
MKNLEAPEIWYITGSQHLYGEQTLRRVASHSQKIVEELNDSQRLGAKFARFDDNMREVAVTEGDKVSAQAKFGYSVDAYGIGDLVEYVDGASDDAVSKLCAEYEERYTVAKELRRNGARHNSLRDGARIELGLRGVLEAGNFKGFTTNFQVLHGLKQLPGLVVQRLMAEGFGFGGEGDWKTCALVRAMKVIAADLPGGTSFMEDYTYHLHPDGHLVLGSHMLEVCESIAAGEPSLEVHPLGIGGKEDPVRLVFNAPPGPAINASIIDLGNRFRLIVNEVDAVELLEPLPKLPVARAVWKVPARFQDSLRGVDLRRRRSSHGLQLLCDDRAHGRSRRNRWRGVGGDRCQNGAAGF